MDDIEAPWVGNPDYGEEPERSLYDYEYDHHDEARDEAWFEENI